MFATRRIELVKPYGLHAIFEEYFGLWLLREGFSYVADRKWVRRRSTEMADMFQLQAMKGASYSPVWGFSLKDAPHVSGGKLRTHNTDKSAILDYRYDPLDVDYGSRTKYEEWFIPRLYGTEYAQRSAKRSADMSMPLALSMFLQVTSIADLSRLYEASFQTYRSGTPYRFGFFSYLQFPIAYALILARQGRYDDGVALLQEAMNHGISYGAALEKILARMRHFE